MTEDLLCNAALAHQSLIVRPLMYQPAFAHHPSAETQCPTRSGKAAVHPLQSYDCTCLIRNAVDKNLRLTNGTRDPPAVDSWHGLNAQGWHIKLGLQVQHTGTK